MILSSQTVDTIYRLNGSDLTYHMEDYLHLLSRWEPYLFSPEGVRRYGHYYSSEDTIFCLITMVLWNTDPQTALLLSGTRGISILTNTICGNPRFDSHKWTMAGTSTTSYPSV